MKLKVSVIIPVKNDFRVIRCLTSLKNQSQEAVGLFEVLVIENGSSMFESVVNELGYRYFHINEGNRAKARNIGLMNTQSEIVAFTDADCICHENWINEIILSMENSFQDVAGGGGSIERYNPKSNVEKYGSNLVNGQVELNYLPILPFPYLVTANAFYKRKALESIGGFDEQFLSGSDVDICYRLALSGHELLLNNSAIIYHENRGNLIDHFKRFHFYSKYQCLLFKKFKRNHNRKFYFNNYHFKCMLEAVKLLPSALKGIWENDYSMYWTMILKMLEGIGVLCGDITGSVKFKVFYI